MTEQMILDRMAQMIRVGFVNARQPEKMRVKVTLKDTTTSPLVTDWLPVLCPRAKDDMQYDLPDIGDQVLCLFLSYGLEQGFVVGAMYGKQTPPVQSGDKWHRTFSDGAKLEYDRASHALIADIPGTANVKCKDSITLEAPIIYLRGTLVNTAMDGSPGNSVFSGGMEVLNGGVNVPDADVQASGVSLVSHTTEGVTPGLGQSLHPTGGSADSPGIARIDYNKFSPDQLALIQNVRLGELRDRVEENGTPHDRLIMCLPDIAEELAKKAEKEHRYKDAIGLRNLSVFFKKWLSEIMNEDVKKSEAEFIDFEWILEFPRAKEIFHNWLTFNEKDKTIFSHAGRTSLSGYLWDKKFMVREKDREIEFTMKDFEYFNYTVIPHLYPWEVFPNKVEGLFAAMGSFTIRAQAQGYTKYLGLNRWEIVVKKICFFIHDQFNFPPELAKEIGAFFTGYGGTFGYWSCEEKKFAKKKVNESYLHLSNSHFREFREKYLRGGDFLIFSDKKCLDIPRGYSYVSVCSK